MTPRQLSYVNRATALLPAAARAQFRQQVATLLGYAEHPIDDRDVLDILRPLLAQHGRSIGEVLPPWGCNFANRQKGDHHASHPVF
jgi:hypothetical protein